MSINLDKFVGTIPSNLDALDDVIITSVTTGQSITWDGSKWVNQDKVPDLANRIVVNTANWASTLGGTIDSLKEYFIDGIVDPQGVSIDLSGGKVLNITGGGTNVSKIVSTANTYTMVTGSDVGEIMMDGVTLTIGGTGSKLLNVTANTGLEAVSFIKVNFDFCTSLGEVNGFNQGLEIITRRFGGTPQLTLSGTWNSGYFVDTSIVRILTDGAYSLFKEGTLFTMASRFRSNQNLDLPASVSFLDFQPSNFLNPNTLQLIDMIVTRNGVDDDSDSNYTPNISRSDLASAWNNNTGLPNTFIGGNLLITTEVTTTISSTGVFVDLAGTYASNDLQHFDELANGQLRYLGNSPTEFKITVDMDLDSGSNNEVDCKVVVWDNSASIFVDYKVKRKVINNLQGGRDVGFFNFTGNITLNQNDYVKLRVANVNNTTDITAELGGEFTVEKR